ncbi:MAG: cadherin repeat domain-containing protein, partial [Cyanobacteria bacterium J06648_11]
MLHTAEMAGLLNDIITAGGTTALAEPVTGSELYQWMQRAPDRSAWHVAEDADGTVVGTVVASDPDAGDTLTFTAIGGTGTGAFGVNPATGEITVTDTSLLDFETSQSITLDVEVSDSGVLTDMAIVTVNLNDINEAPVVADQSFAIAENSSNGTSVGTVAASDPDASTMQSYAVTGGTGSSAFAIDTATGEITVVDSSLLDFETSPSLTLDVEVSDGTLSDTATVTIALNDVNEAPVLANQTFAIAENSTTGISVGTLSASDPDAGDVLTYAVTGGSGTTAFSVDPATGEISVADSTQLDFETTTSFTLDIEVSDGMLTDTAIVTIDVNDINEDPVPAFLRVEAESIADVTNYRLEGNATASGTQMLGLGGNGPGEIGTASFAFPGSAGTYDIVLGTYDENDGAASFTLTRNGTQIGTTVVLDQDLGFRGASRSTQVTPVFATGVT